MTREDRKKTSRRDSNNDGSDRNNVHGERRRCEGQKGVTKQRPTDAGTNRSISQNEESESYRAKALYPLRRPSFQRTTHRRSLIFHPRKPSTAVPRFAIL